MASSSGDVVSLMRAALAAEADSQRRSEKKSAPMAKLVSGTRTRQSGNNRIYRFRKASWPALLQAERGLLVSAKPTGPWSPVSESEPVGSMIQLTCQVDLDQTAYVREDPSGSLHKLSEALDSLPAERRQRAGLVMGTGNPRVSRSANAAALTTKFDELNPAQQEAVSKALASEITFVWGPPGTGKTDVIARIVEGSLRQGLSVLFVAPTHVAVDQALERICDLISNLDQFRDGLVRRVGGAQVQSLIDKYGDVIDPERVLARLAGPLDDKITNLRNRQTELSSRLQLREEADALLAELRELTTKADQAANQYNALSAEVARTQSMLATAHSRAVDAQSKRFTLPGTVEKRQDEYYRASHAVQLAQAAFSAADGVVQQARARLPQLQRESARAQSAAGAESAKSLRSLLQSVSTSLQQAGAERAQLDKRLESSCKLAAMTAQRSYQGRMPAETPDVVLVDEAGMVDLPTAYHLTSRAHRRVVFAGDFRQLPAVVVGDADNKASEQNRILVRDWVAKDAFHAAGVVGHGGQVLEDRRLVRLDTQYRMRPQICALVNAVAYPDAPLRTGRKDFSTVTSSALLSAPLAVIDTSGLPVPDRSTYRNDVHAALIREYIRLLQGNSVLPARRATNTAPAQLAVIAPYNQQVKLISGHLKERLGEEFEGLVDTVHRFQGSQRPIVIIDAVTGSGALGVFFEKTGLGSTTCRLLNVALSRAQHHVIVVANFRHMRSKLRPDSEVLIMLDHLVRHAQQISPKELIPIRTAAELSALSTEDLARPAFFPADETDQAISWDFDRATREVKIFCPFLHDRRISRFWATLTSAVARGVRVTVVTRGTSDHVEHGPIIAKLASGGIEVTTRDQMHEKLITIDDVLWLGSQNLFANTRATELMTRIVSATACAEALRTAETAQPTRPRTSPPPGNRIYLNTTYEEKELVKKLGARFDGQRKKWYVDRSNQHLDQLSRWLPPTD
ncbi:hypothetical protein D5S17_12190 [Pseudonocardiaceae bacterium YIM PH 21723]|nr:hypothetical protein D5S17_12190 [Pseudonocardiaceae bacterium YIM PH 21723]